MTNSLKNPRFIQALRKQPVDATPVWLMRQAGRYLPEYRATRAKAGDFLTLAKTPELACEVTLQPLRRFELDAAILFSDILTVPDAMGLGLYFSEGEGPRFKQAVRDRAAIERLPVPDPERELRYVMDAVRLIRRELDGSVPLIGFAGSPWTLACYMVEGGSSDRFAQIKRLMLDEPAVLHSLLEKNAQATIAYLAAQIAAGAQAIMVFDSWGGILAPHHYREFSLRYLRDVVHALKQRQECTDTPIILFSKGVADVVAIADSGCDAVGVDWTCDLAQVRSQIGQRVCIQGNMDPAVLLAGENAVVAETHRLLARFGPHHGHIFNLGHGITPDVDPDNVRAMVDAVHSFSAHLHRHGEMPSLPR